jgi:glycerol-3-phosphate dehydrogenase
MPSYHWWETPFYGAGLTAYDAAGRKGRSGCHAPVLGRTQTLKMLSNARPRVCRGGVLYWDGQFNDARLAMALARSAAAQGALLVNYCRRPTLIEDSGKVVGLRCEDARPARTSARAA